MTLRAHIGGPRARVLAGALALLGPCFLGLSTSQRAAEAQVRVPRIAVGPFEGERAAVTRGMVGSVFSDHVGEIELVSASEFNAAAERAGVTGRSDADAMAQLARPLRLDQVVVGNLERRPRGYRLQLRVLRGRDGQVAGTAAWEVDRLEEVSALGTEIWDQLQAYLRPEGVTTLQGGNRSTFQPPNERVQGGASGLSGPPPSLQPSPPDAGLGLGFLSARVGGGTASRSWRVPVLGERTPRGYENDLYGELQAGLALRYVFSARRYGFGLDAHVAVPVGLSSQGRSPDGRVVTLSTSAVQALIGAQFAHRPRDGGGQYLTVGMVYSTFTLDTSQLAPEQRVASTTYIGLRVAGEGHLPLYANAGFELDAIMGGEFRLVGIGTDLKKSFGQNPETTLGFGAWFGLGVRLDRFVSGLGFRGTAEWVRYRTTYAGPATVGTGADAVDDYTRFVFAMTYELGAGESARPSAPRRGPAGRPARNEGDRATGDPFGGR